MEVGPTPLLLSLSGALKRRFAWHTGRQLGAGDIKAAKRTAFVMVASGTALAVTYSLAIYGLGEQIGVCDILPADALPPPFAIATCTRS